MPVPCDCCPIDPVFQRCALITARFDAVAETSPGAAGWSAPLNLGLTIDGVTNSATLSGYQVAGNPPPAPTPVVDYTLTTPVGRVRGVRLWNQGGGILTDNDGLGPSTVVTFLDSADAVIYSSTLAAGNGAAAFDTLIPGGSAINGVKTVRLSNLGKLTASSAAPFWRELQLLLVVPVFPCRRPNGAVEWYDQAGDLVPAANQQGCAEAAPVVMIDLAMNGTAFADAPNEFICNVVPVPAATTGWTVAGACYDPVIGNPSMTWPPTSSMTLEYGSAAGVSGGVFVTFSSVQTGPVTFPTNLSMMAPGDVRTSNPLLNGRRVDLTYISGPAATDPSGTVRMEGGATLGLHRTAINIAPPIRFRLDAYQP